MCRLLIVKAQKEFEIAPLLSSFAELCLMSREYQGHGWGMVYEKNGARQLYHSVDPIWENKIEQFGSSRFLLVHARSAFRDEGITIENNMPFVDDRYAFVFNGELRGVKVKAQGRIGAEKVFNVVKRFDSGDMAGALRRTVPFMERRSTYIRAMNMMITDMKHAYVCSYFNEDPDYFTLHKKEDPEMSMICSQPFPGEKGWAPISRGTIAVI